MKKELQDISRMYLHWKLISDVIENLHAQIIPSASSLRWNASVLETRAKDCIEAMKKVADIMEKEENDDN